MKQRRYVILKTTSLILLMIFLLVGCFSNKVSKEEKKTQKSPEEIRIEMEQAEAEAFVDSTKNNPELYWGEGIVRIGTDLGKAKQKANKRAIEDLSKTIEVHVESDISRTLSGHSFETGKMYEEKVEEKIKSRTRIYTNQVISDVMEKDFIDYPRKGYVTYIVSIPKRRYNEKVERDLKTKKMRIRKAVKDGNKEFANRNYMSALNNWVNANIYLDNFFGDLPLMDDLNNDSTRVEVNAYLDGKINNFFGNIILSKLSSNISSADKGKIAYDTNGKVNRQPSVYAQYKSSNGEKYPISKLPLKVDIIEGDGSIMNNLTTGSYGQSELQINYIDPKNKFTAIKVSIDTDKINGIKEFSLPNLSSLTLKLFKEKSVALTVKFYNQNQTENSPGLNNRLKNLLIDNGYSVVEVPIKGVSITEKDIAVIKETNADYFLSIILTTSNISQVGGYDNMYSANCSGSMELYNLQTGKVVATKNIEIQDGFGVSGKSAGWDAFGKQVEVVVNTARSIVGRIK